MSIRLGAVSYLNTKPLIDGLLERLPGCSLSLDLPSRLADRLQSGDLDVALIPSVEFFRGGENLRIISNACIACRGSVRSVQLLFRKPPPLVETLALDVGSRTSAALARVLLNERFGVQPRVTSLSLEADFYSAAADAILVIGDRAMKIDDRRFVECWDLGAHWKQWTGLPFVFAMWVARPSESNASSLPMIAEVLENCRDQGLAGAKGIAERIAGEYGLSVEDCLLYFTEQLHFTLGENERAGLQLFQRYAQDLGLTGDYRRQLPINVSN
jgi:chorismate dehydratase